MSYTLSASIPRAALSTSTSLLSNTDFAKLKAYKFNTQRSYTCSLLNYNYPLYNNNSITRGVNTIVNISNICQTKQQPINNPPTNNCNVQIHVNSNGTWNQSTPFYSNIFILPDKPPI
jgi:hypothetical protein